MGIFKSVSKLSSFTSEKWGRGERVGVAFLSKWVKDVSANQSYCKECYSSSFPPFAECKCMPVICVGLGKCVYHNQRQTASGLGMRRFEHNGVKIGQLVVLS